MKKLFLSFILFFIQFSNAQEKGLRVDYINYLGEDWHVPRHTYLDEQFIISHTFSSDYTDSIYIQLVDYQNNDTIKHCFDATNVENTFTEGEIAYPINYYGSYNNVQWTRDGRVLDAQLGATDVEGNQVIVVVRFDLGDIDNPYLTHKYEISPSVFDIPEDLAINSWIDVWTTQESYLFDPEIQNGLTITGNFMNETWEHAGSFLLKYLPENEDLDIKYFWTYNDNSNLYTLINSSMDGSILENWSAEEHFSIILTLLNQIIYITVGEGKLTL